MAGAAEARPFGVEGVTPAEVQGVMRAMGLSVQSSEQSEGRPGLAASYGGVSYDVAFHDCDASMHCKSVQIYAGFNLHSAVSVDLINRWNQQWRFGYGSVDPQGAAFLQIDFDASYGSTEQVRAYIERFHQLAPQFAQFIGYTR